MKIDIGRNLMMVAIVLPIIVYIAKAVMLIALERARATQVIRIENNRIKGGR
jgi:hypothetical protein